MKRILLVGFGIAIVLIGCDKTKDIFQTTKTTPYNLTISSGLSSNAFKVPADNPLTKEGVALGRMLFYDPILSADSTMSCATCHKQKFAFTDSTVRFSKGIDGSLGNRNAMPLFNLAFDRSYFWDGRSASLEAQALKPIEDIREMKHSVSAVLIKLNASATYQQYFKDAFGPGPITATQLAKALSQFERIILSGDSKYDKYMRGEATLTTQEKLGFNLFEGSDPLTQGDCIHCHAVGNTFTDYEFKNNGLDTIFTDLGRYEVTGLINDKGKFKTPTLRNIALTAPYMHDGRFKNLEEVMGHYNIQFHKNSADIDPVMASQAKDRLNKADRDAIIAFLKTLTDSVMLKNPEYSSPF
jgi:cytochrome c peroxidase